MLKEKYQDEKKKLKRNIKKRVVNIIKLENKLVLGISDRFIIRSYSPVVTIGGGVVFDKCYILLMIVIDVD